MRLRLICLTALAVGVLAAPAMAAPARTQELTANGTPFTWTDGPRSALGTEVTEPPVDMCDDPGWPCDDTLIHVTEPGTLTLNAKADGLVRPDVDVYLYMSDADGTAGDMWDMSESTSADETLVEDLDAGWYLFRVAYFSGLNDTYAGSAALTPTP
jgi:hypothetical protein